MNARRRRFRVGHRARQRIAELGPISIWINWGKRLWWPNSISVHLWFATWNSERGWYLDGPLGFYLQERRDRRNP